MSAKRTRADRKSLEGPANLNKEYYNSGVRKPHVVTKTTHVTIEAGQQTPGSTNQNLTKFQVNGGTQRHKVSKPKSSFIPGDPGSVRQSKSIMNEFKSGSDAPSDIQQAAMRGKHTMPLSNNPSTLAERMLSTHQ